MPHATEIESPNLTGPLKHLLVAGAIAAALISIFAFAKSWFILPYKIELQESAITQLQNSDREATKEAREQREILIRIEEQLNQVRLDLRYRKVTDTAK